MTLDALCDIVPATHPDTSQQLDVEEKTVTGVKGVFHYATPHDELLEKGVRGVTGLLSLSDS